jgi:hypothetical protein
MNQVMFFFLAVLRNDMCTATEQPKNMQQIFLFLHINTCDNSPIFKDRETEEFLQNYRHNLDSCSAAKAFIAFSEDGQG